MKQTELVYELLSDKWAGAFRIYFGRGMDVLLRYAYTAIVSISFEKGKV